MDHPLSRARSEARSRRRRRWVLGGPVAGLLAASVTFSLAATYVYTGGGAGTAQDPVDGSFASGFTPTLDTSDTAAVLSFGGLGSDQYTATAASNSTFAELDLNSGSSKVETIAGNLTATQGAIVQSGSGSFTLPGALTFSTLSLQGTGSGPLVLGQAIGGISAMNAGTPGSRLTQTGFNTTTATGAFTGSGITVAEGVLNVNGGAKNGSYFDPNQGKSVSFGANFEADGPGTLNFNSALTVSAGTFGSVIVAAKGGGMVNIRADNAASVLAVAGGSVMSVNGAGRLVSATGVTLSGGGNLTLDNTASPGVVDRLANTLALTLQGSSLTYLGHAGGSMEASGPLTLAQTVLTRMALA